MRLGIQMVNLARFRGAIVSGVCVVFTLLTSGGCSDNAERRNDVSVNDGGESWRRFPEGSEERRQAASLWMAANLARLDAKEFPTSERTIQAIIDAPQFARFKVVLMDLLRDVESVRATHKSEYEVNRTAGRAHRALYHAEGFYSAGLPLTYLAEFFNKLPQYYESDVQRELRLRRKDFDSTLAFVDRRLEALQREPPTTRTTFGVDLDGLGATRAEAVRLSESAALEIASGDPVLAYIEQVDANRLVYQIKIALREYSNEVYSKTVPQGM